MRTAVLLLLAVACAAAFRCQQIINTYNAHVNTGNFTGAAALTFDENVRYIIPGTQPQCPYCTTYEGKAAVISLFVDGFLGHFTILNPLVNLREITTDTGGPGGVPELMDFNDEAFRNHPQFGGRYFRVHVIHDFLFDPSTCLITQMHLYHDPYVAAMAFAGHPAVTVPIMPGLAQIPPATSFVVTSAANLNNWQFIPTEDTVSPAAAWSTITAYYAALQSGDAQSSSTLAALFIELDYTVPQAMAAVLLPGDPSVLPFGSLWMDLPEIQTYHQQRAKYVRENSPLTDPNAHNVTVGGSVAVIWRMQGTAINTGLAYASDAVDYFQLITVGGVAKIARLSRFFDTWNVTLALTGGEEFPQFAAYSVPGAHKKAHVNQTAIIVGSVLGGVTVILAAALVFALCTRRSGASDSPASNAYNKM